MKSLRNFIILLAATLTFTCCEKLYTEEEEEKKEHKNDKDDDDDSGWIIEDGDEEDDSGFQVGDTVDVKTFIEAYITRQVWVKGYIVGAATGARHDYRYIFNPPYKYSTSILIADSPDENRKDSTVAICLTSCSKKIRTKLNLVDHPENKGKRVAIFGFQESYLKLTGVKKIDAYRFPLK